ncbi:MAG: plasmid pRiA4b ORF-3 family protein [Betaproteobacteria bacterium]
MIHQYKISLRYISPTIWRRIQVPGGYTFWDLHVAIQDSMGWLDYHLHAFRFARGDGKHPVEIGIADGESEYPVLAGWEVGIADHFTRPGVFALYEYDFGDGWEHDIVLEDILPHEPKQTYPRCIAGERACPPEDCGGVPGYEHLVEVLRRPKHPEHAESVEWLKGHARNYHPFDPDRFNARTVRFSNPKKRWAKAFAGRGNR